MSESLIQDVQENLTALAAEEGIDGPGYSRQVEYYREVAALLGCSAEVERVIAVVAAESLVHANQQPERGDRRGLAG